MPAKDSLHMLCVSRDRSEVPKSYIFQGYDNKALQGLNKVTPLLYSVYLRGVTECAANLFQKVYSRLGLDRLPSFGPTAAGNMRLRRASWWGFGWGAGLGPV